MSRTAEREPLWTRHAAIFIAGGYCLISLFYIFTSDQLVLMLFDDPQRITLVQSVKGWGFVIASSVLLFLVMHVAFNRVRRSRQAEVAANEQFRTIVETTNEGAWLIGADGRTTFVNDHFVTMVGRDRDELLGKPQDELLDDEWADVLVQQFERQRQGFHDQCECQLVRPDGKKVWVSVSASPIMDRHGRFIGCIRMVTDITKLKTTEEALKASLKSQRQLLNELDHRVRNNLSSLVSLVDISRGGASDLNAFADSIRGRINAMNRAYGLLSSSGWKRQNLHRMLQTLVQSKYSSRIELAGAHVEFAPHQSGAIAIVIHELLSNAIRHGALSNDEGRIGITWRLVERSEHAAEIELRWTEGGGPPIVGAIAPGTGVPLIKGLIESDLRGTATLGFPAEGAQHVLRMRLDDAKLEDEADDDTTITERPSDDLWTNGRAEAAQSSS